MGCLSAECWGAGDVAVAAVAEHRREVRCVECSPPPRHPLSRYFAGAGGGAGGVGWEFPPAPVEEPLVPLRTGSVVVTLVGFDASYTQMPTTTKTTSAMST